MLEREYTAFQARLSAPSVSVTLWLRLFVTDSIKSPGHRIGPGFSVRAAACHAAFGFRVIRIAAAESSNTTPSTMKVSLKPSTSA